MIQKSVGRSEGATGAKRAYAMKWQIERWCSRLDHGEDGMTRVYAWFWETRRGGRVGMLCGGG